MRTGTLMRRIAAAILISFAALLAVALAPLISGGRIADGVPLSSGVIALPSDWHSVSQRTQLFDSPDIALLAGTLSATRGPDGSARALILTGPTLEVSLSSVAVDPATPAGAALNPETLIAPLIEKLMALDSDRLLIHRGTIRFVWGRGQSGAQPDVKSDLKTDLKTDGQSVTLTDVEADIATRSKSSIAAMGTFVYRGLAASFETKAGAPQAVDNVAGVGPHLPKRAMSWPLQAKIKSGVLDVTLDGTMERAAGWSLKAQTDARSSDLARLSSALGYDWRSNGSPIAFQMRGPAIWSDSKIAFAKSHVSLSDQDGVGAAALSLRGERPLIEATLAFAALDAAPLLRRSAWLPSLTPVKPASWRTVATTFPAIARLDADLRISAQRLQWQGEPIGKAALTVSANNGVLHADFAELAVGPHQGSVQVVISEVKPNAPATIRGRFETTDTAALAVDVFGGLSGVQPMQGKGVVTVDLSGRGATLGDVWDGAHGRGTLEARDGQIGLDLAAIQKLALVAGQRDIPLPWATIAAPTSFEALDLKFLLRPSEIVIDQAAVSSKALRLTAEGRVDLAAPNVDLRMAVASAQAQPGGPRIGTAKPLSGPRAGKATAGDVVNMRGPWTALRVSTGDAEPAP